ncbi:MAG: hypothetical protein GOMPHAMPRED_005428 [Gomphillus americanus]|uniref:Uncharacterized protein n=1 Tax=Gomphillus americanus TaxID=1940652 RepID=A0A8H3IS32_9LECA|nr:MAG: hypothetical protein GOMPHAMPRED_005428 [Gomphillus americanus]
MFYSTEHQIVLIKVTYGNKDITDQTILNRIKHDLSERSTAFIVSNEDLGGDPQPGVPKRLTVDYRDHPDHPYMRISGAEGDSMSFEYRVSRVKYGGVELNNHPEVVERLNRAIVDTAKAQKGFLNKIFTTDTGRLRITNENIGGDPRPGVEKEAEVQVLTRGDMEYYSVKTRENDLLPPLGAATSFNFTDIPVMK